MSELQAAPILSTPADDAFAQVVQPVQHKSLPDDQIDIQYEVRRTVQEIRSRKWRRVGLQFPDDMLPDAPRVLERLSRILKADEVQVPNSEDQASQTTTSDKHDADRAVSNGEVKPQADIKLTILGDTSYGSCCVDEIAAEHVDADGVVHYGRTCLSPTQRLSVVYVYTARSLDINSTVRAFVKEYADKDARVCLLADVPYQHHLPSALASLTSMGYTSVFAPELAHDPSSPIPNRALPEDLRDNAEALREVNIFHVGNPPTALLLTLASRTKSIKVYSEDDQTVGPSQISMISRRRYAALLKLTSAAVIGILINTLSVKNYLQALDHVKSLIAAAGKKSYTFVVGKLNTAKLANFAEVEGWVVIGCWESSLIDSKEFLVPVVTPFELELALKRDDERIWGQEWVADFQTLLQRKNESGVDGTSVAVDDALEDNPSDDEPPEFDLRTGRYTSTSRPLAAKPRQAVLGAVKDSNVEQSSALAKRATGELATINGVSSPGAAYLRQKREWQGLGSDFEVAYDRNEDGSIQGALVEQGRAGVAKGYSHAELNGTT